MQEDLLNAMVEKVSSPDLEIHRYFQSLFFHQHGNFPETDCRYSQLLLNQSPVDLLKTVRSQSGISFCQPDKNMRVKKQHYSASQ